MNKMTPKKWIGLFLKVMLAGVISVFIGSESLNFFEFVFPAEQWFLAYTGFGLTIGSVFVYLYLFLYDAETSLQRTIALLMALVGIVGELFTAGFGMQIEAWRQAGFTLTESDYTFMILAVRILMLLHGLALLAYFAGNKVVELLSDEDGDGIPNIMDRDYKKNRKSQQPRPAYAQTAQAPQHTLAELSDITGMTAGQMRAKFKDYDEFAAFASDKFDYISGKNMKRLYDEINPTSRQSQK